ncbi:MAG: hypothetical protein KAR40_06570 [Candidatus Sabulitectum sp.]|nr:hypothetical protein [Candidatus Sabulitectum sp.]
MTAVFLFLGLVLNPSVLFVGNSYTAANGGIWGQVKQIYESVESDTLTVYYQTMGGASFEIHWANQSLINEIQSGKWGTVVFQEQSCMPVIDPAQTYLFGDSLAWLTAASGGEPVFFMTWARKKDPVMLEGLELGYSRMGAVHNSTVAPCGIAFDLVRRAYPEIDPYAGDGAHPSLHGTYLAACVIATVVYGVDIIGGSVWQPSGITVEDGEILRSVAVQSCADYQQPGGESEQ